MIDSSFNLECNVETLRKFRSRGVKTITKCSHYKCSMKKRMRLSKRKSSDTTDDQHTDEQPSSSRSLRSKDSLEKKRKMVGRKPFLNKEKAAN